jgi:hypothetical protein
MYMVDTALHSLECSGFAVAQPTDALLLLARSASVPLNAYRAWEFRVCKNVRVVFKKNVSW